MKAVFRTTRSSVDFFPALPPPVLKPERSCALLASPNETFFSPFRRNFPDSYLSHCVLFRGLICFFLQPPDRTHPLSESPLPSSSEAEVSCVGHSSDVIFAFLFVCYLSPRARLWVRHRSPQILLGVPLPSEPMPVVSVPAAFPPFLPLTVTVCSFLLRFVPFAFNSVCLPVPCVRSPLVAPAFLLNGMPHNQNTPLRSPPPGAMIRHLHTSALLFFVPTEIAFLMHYSPPPRDPLVGLCSMFPSADQIVPASSPGSGVSSPPFLAVSPTYHRWSLRSLALGLATAFFRFLLHSVTESAPLNSLS